MQSKRAKLLKKYLSKNDRINTCLSEIVTLYKQKPAHPAIKILIKKQLKALIAFKSLILLHYLLHQNAIDYSLCSNILKGMVFDSRQQFDAVISQKYLNPYRLFLQRRSQNNLKKEPKTLQQSEVLFFQLINIIKASQMFQQIIYIFGRYFFEKYKFIIDFNIILAKDISKLYAALQEKLPPPYTSAFLKEIQLAHQAMYPIYFNNYFFQHLRTFTPKWINTQYKEEQKTKQKISEYKGYYDSTAQRSDQKEVYMQDRSFDAISEQFEQATKEQDQYLVDQFKIDEEQERCKEQQFLKPCPQQKQDFFTQ